MLLCYHDIFCCMVVIPYLNGLNVHFQMLYLSFPFPEYIVLIPFFASVSFIFKFLKGTL